MDPEEPISRVAARFRGACIGGALACLPLIMLAVVGARYSPAPQGAPAHFEIAVLMYVGIPFCGVVGAILGAIAASWNWDWEQKNGVPEDEDEPQEGSDR